MLTDQNVVSLNVARQRRLLIAVIMFLIAVTQTSQKSSESKTRMVIDKSRVIFSDVLEHEEEEVLT